MKHPLEKYRAIADKDFLSNIEDKFYIVRYSELLHNTDALQVILEKENKRIRIEGIDMFGEGYIIDETLLRFFLSEYNNLEKETRSNIDAFILTILEKPKQQLFIENTISELKELQNTINRNSLEVNKNKIKQKHQDLVDVLQDKVETFSKLIENVYQSETKKNSVSGKRLQWTKDGKILTCLFRDLLYGNDEFKTPKVINADNEDDVADFIYNNFLDRKGDTFDIDTLKKGLRETNTEGRPKRSPAIKTKPYFESE